MLPAVIIQIPFACISLAVVFPAAVLLDDHLRTGWNYLGLLGVDKGSSKHLPVIFLFAVSLSLTQAVVGTHLFGGVNAGPVKGQKIMAIQPGHLLHDLASLQQGNNRLK
jgi:hypothetical protein